MSHKRHGLLDHRPLECMFNSFFRFIIKDRSKVTITVPVWPVDSLTKGQKYGKRFHVTTSLCNAKVSHAFPAISALEGKTATECKDEVVNKLPKAYVVSRNNIKILNMLNCFKDYNRYINMLNHILDLAWAKSIKLTLKQQYMLSVLHAASTMPADTLATLRVWVSVGMVLASRSRKISSPASEEFRCINSAWNVRYFVLLLKIVNS